MNHQISNFTQFVRSFTYFSDNEIEQLWAAFEHQTVKKKVILAETGRIAKEVYFVQKGSLRSFYNKDGIDISAYFFTENTFAGSYDSFIAQRPSSHFLETLEDCELLVISYDKLQQLFVNLPIMNEFVRKIVEERFVTLHQLFTSHILDSPEERYLHLLESRPDWLTRFPQHQIATFLGITPVSLSRIRQRLSKKS